MIRIDTVWLAVEPLDMRAGTETAMARVVKVFGAARPHHAYLFANRRANRMKVTYRAKVPDGSATAKAMDYSLKRWGALTRYLDDPALPIDNNFDEQQIRPWATGRKNWLFVGTLLAGQRAAAIMSLIQSAKLNGHDPYVYLRDVLTRLSERKVGARCLR